MSEVTHVEREDLRDVVVETFNARHWSLLTELAETRPYAPILVEQLQLLAERWPRQMLSRGDLAGTPVAVMWSPDRNERYVATGFVEIVLSTTPGETRLELVPEMVPDVVAEALPGTRVAEWESQAAIESGAGGWV